MVPTMKIPVPLLNGLRFIDRHTVDFLRAKRKTKRYNLMKLERIFQAKKAEKFFSKNGYCQQTRFDVLHFNDSSTVCLSMRCPDTSEDETFIFLMIF